MRDVDVTLLNWEKYQFRKQVKHPSWFRLENRLWQDQQFFYFTAEERWVWICLLSLASQKQSATLSIGLEWFSINSGVGIPTIESALQKLKDNKCLEYTLHARNVHVPTCVSTRQDRHNKTIQDKTKKTDISIDADASRLASPVLEKGSSSSRLIGEYAKAYKARYNASPVIDGPTQGSVKRILKSVSEQKAIDLVQAYLQMNEPWFVTKAHDFITFEKNLTKIGLALQKGVDLGAPPKKKTFEELLAEQEREKNGSSFLQTTDRKT